MYSENFDDSIFDTEEILINIEESVNIYEESLRDDLIMQGKKSYNKAIRKLAVQNNKDIRDKFDDYKEINDEYYRKADRGFQFDPLREKERLTNYQRQKNRNDSSLQKRRLAIEEEYKSRKRQAVTPQDKQDAKKAYKAELKMLARTMDKYNKQNREAQSVVPRNKKDQRALQEQEFNANMQKLNKEREAAKNDYMHAANKYVRKNSLYTNKKNQIVDKNTQMTKLDRKALRRAYKEMDGQVDRANEVKMLQNARNNGYYQDPYDKKTMIKNRLAAKGKLPDHMKGFED